MLGGIARLVDCYMFPFLGAQTQGYGPKFLGIWRVFVNTSVTSTGFYVIYSFLFDLAECGRQWQICAHFRVLVF